MKKERLRILEQLYKEAKEFNSMDSGIVVEHDEMVEANFDLQYLEKTGYIEVEDLSKGIYINITPKGVDLVESMEDIMGTVDHDEIAKSCAEISETLKRLHAEIELDGKKIAEVIHSVDVPVREFSIEDEIIRLCRELGNEERLKGC
ncbi:hypothetical protein [Rossellomorea sp. BNER]|uniref:hypothetical protein n=1 Tax=Rossellomorea sp. BNER TaxID=2962031 RepID=UPI003AF2917D|nr:hypothetical protein [Rossellomorea sp. BNER]